MAMTPLVYLMTTPTVYTASIIVVYKTFILLQERTAQLVRAGLEVWPRAAHLSSSLLENQVFVHFKESVSPNEATSFSLKRIDR